MKKASFTWWIKKYFFNWFHIWDAHSLGQDLGRFWKPASQLIKYVHIDPVTDFCILVIPETIFQAREFKVASVGALNILNNINPKFSDNRKIIILQIIWRLF